MSVKDSIFSIRARLMLGTTLLVALVTAVLVTLWVQSERAQVRRLKRHEAEGYALSLAGAWGNELEDQNWNQIRVQLAEVLDANPELTYILVTDASQDHRIVAAHPSDQIGRYVTDLVPARVSRAAQRSGPPREQETYLLRDIGFAEDGDRGRRGERVIEVASDVRVFEQEAGMLRVGVSLDEMNRASEEVLERALVASVGCTLLGLFGAWIVARRLTGPVHILEASAMRMADGDLEHRADVHRRDEIGALADAFNRMASALAESFRQLQGTLASFERFVPQKFLQVVASEGIENIEVGEKATHPLTILFADIRGYTAMSERSSAEEMFDFLNEYLPLMGEAIERSGGFIDKYIGDAVMALFDDASTDGALDAALGMRAALDAFNVAREERGEVAVDIGIGIHRGRVVIGTIGFRSRIESTVIGDPVNLASRVEGLTKQHGVAILVTEDVISALDRRERYVLRLVDGEAVVKGKDEPVALYSLEGYAGSESE